MRTVCMYCGKKIDKNDGIRVPAIVNNEHGSFYYCSAKCLGNGLTIKCEGAFYYCSSKCLGDDLCIKADTIVNLDLTDEQFSKIADILAD